MSGEDPQLDRWKQATAATLRALAHAPDLIVDYSRDPSGPLGSRQQVSRVRLPSLAGLSDEVREQVRGAADALAAEQLYHDAALHQRHRPFDAPAQDVFDALEAARVEILAAKAHKGVGQNLAARLAASLPDVKTPDLPQAMQARLWDLQQPVDELPARISRAANSAASLDLARLSNAIADQRAYAAAVNGLLQELGLVPLDPQTEESGEEAEAPAESTPDDQAEGEEEAVQQVPAQEGEDDDSEAAEATAATPTPTDLVEDNSEGSEPQEAKPPAERPEESSLTIPYRVYTTQFDEIAAADTLASPDELTRLRGLLDKQLQNMHGLVAKLAHRLQRKLLAAQNRSWEFDTEEGMINSGRLPRLIMDPTVSTIYKREHDTTFRDTIVTLLLDNSGSMRGRPITIAALSADILARTLERCGVKVEILGFTTRTWKGGQAREQWQAEGRPPLPGRLNELRHIIYKEADHPYRRSRRNLALMLREGLLKENIDGEALTWAARRLLKRSERRRILMVISDGAPVDDATLAANPGGYLEAHLKAVIEWIETQTPIELLAIGIGHDVTRYYRKAVKIADVEELGPTMTAELGALFATRR